MWCLFCHLFLISPSFGASGRPCFATVVFSGYLHLYVCIWWVLSVIVITSLGKRNLILLCFSLVCNVCNIC